MNPYGDGSDGTLNVTSGTTNLLLNRKYQFQNFKISSGATVSTSSTTGSVLYISSLDTIEINGTIDVSNKVNNGHNVWSVNIDGITYTSPGVADGGRGGVSSDAQASQGSGFGGGGQASSDYGLSGGNGANGSPSFGVAGGQTIVNRTSLGTSNQSGKIATPGSAGGGGGSLSVIGQKDSTINTSITAIGGAGGSNYGANGQDGTRNATFSGSGILSAGIIANGGGGAGGRAGKSGVHIVLNAPKIIINGRIVTSGTSGQNGGGGGRNITTDTSGTWSAGSNMPVVYSGFGGSAGGGGGGGNAGKLYINYGSSMSLGMTYVGAGGGGGKKGSTWYNNTTQPDVNATDGGSGTSGEYITSQIPPYTDFTATPTSGNRPLSVNFNNQSIGADTYLWDFGDGTTSTSRNPTHLYAISGTYTVTLESTNDSGSTSKVRSNYITVSIQIAAREAKGTLLLGGSANRRLKTYREAAGTIALSGSVNAFIRKETDSIESKTFLFKVYDQNGDYIETWYRDVISEPSYSQEINEIGSTMELELARNSDSLATSTGPLQTEDGQTITTEDGLPILASVESREQVGAGSSVNHNNRVDVWVYYGGIEPLLTEAGEEILTENGEPILATMGAPNGLRIFSGFISDIDSRYGDTETTLVQLSSYGYDLEQYPVTDGSGKTKVTFNSVDPSQIARTVIDQFVEDANDDAGSIYDIYTHRTDTSVSNTSTSVSYTFNNNTYADAISKVLELMPSNWFYYVGLGDNTVYYRERSSTPQHLFYLGRHIKALDLRTYIGDSVNRVIFTGGEVSPGVNLYRNYQYAPANRTRRKLHQYSDQRVIRVDSSEILSKGMIDSKNKVQYRSTIDILSKQYDIESINVGDMVGFRNFGNYVDALMLQVVAKTYTPDAVTLQLDSITPSVNKRLEDLRRNMTVSDNQNTPDTPL